MLRSFNDVTPASACNAAGTAVVDPSFAGVETVVPRTPFADANQQTILNTNPDRIGLGDFTRNDGAHLKLDSCVNACELMHVK